LRADDGDFPTLGGAAAADVGGVVDRGSPRGGARSDLRWMTVGRRSEYPPRVQGRRTRFGVPLADAALALGLLLLKLTFVFSETLMSGGATPLSVVSATALTVPLAWRRRAPLLVAAIVAGTIVIDDLLAGWSGAVISFDCSIVAAYSAGAYASQRRAAVALALLACANLVDAAGAPGNLAGNVALGLAVFSAIPWLVGQALRRERSRSLQLEQLASRLATERDERDRAAVLAERGRIARELHDIVAHAISLITVQADAASKVLRHDPDRAREPLEAIQATSRGALGEMRQLVGLLRESDDSAPLQPQPGLAELARVIGDARQSGLAVTFEISGDVRPLPATLDLAVYRIVQEGLTNVRKHAGPAEAHVTVRFERDCLEIQVRDDGRGGAAPDAGGHGLVGVRERVALLGGELESGPPAGGGFLVRARLPLEAPAR
jgi:signal transduction histidine kinase